MENHQLTQNESAPLPSTATHDGKETFDTRTGTFSGWRLDLDDWVWLNPGYKVQVRRRNEALMSGSVDVVAPDASVFWVWLDRGGLGRVALHEDDDVTVWVERTHAAAIPNLLVARPPKTMP